jgi:molybdopterin converting factor small subunit
MQYDIKRGSKLSVLIHLHKIYRQYSDGRETVQVDGRSVKECMESLIELYPGLEKALYTGEETLHPLVGIFVNSESAYPDALGREVKDGDKIHLIHTLAGG